MRIDSILKIVLTFMLILSCSDKSSNKIQNELCAVRSNISLIPPSPITKQILLDIRGGIWNDLEEDERFEISVYVDNVDDQEFESEGEDEKEGIEEQEAKLSNLYNITSSDREIIYIDLPYKSVC